MIISYANCFSFGRATRSNATKKNDEPGPGQYELPIKFADVPKYLIPEKSKAQTNALDKDGNVI